MGVEISGQGVGSQRLNREMNSGLPAASGCGVREMKSEQSAPLREENSRGGRRARESGLSG